MPQMVSKINESLDLRLSGTNCAAMTKIRLLAAAPLAALITLAACQSEPETVGKAKDPMAEELKNAPPVELPPAMIARTFRCADNSLIYADFSADGQFARIGTSQSERVRVTAAEANSNYSGEGYTVSANAEDARIKAPGKSEQRCRAHNNR